MQYSLYRCKKCEKLLFKGVLVDSEVEVKCKRCGTQNVFHGIAKEFLLCFKPSCPNRVSAPVDPVRNLTLHGHGTPIVNA